MKDPASTYTETLGTMAELAGDTGRVESGSRDWNRHVDRLQEVRKVLSTTAEGRRTIAAMMTDSRVTVRLWAASHALHWPESSEQARRVLKSMILEESYGLNRLNAQMTLSEFDAGRMNPDW